MPAKMSTNLKDFLLQDNFKLFFQKPHQVEYLIKPEKITLFVTFILDEFFSETISLTCSKLLYIPKTTQKNNFLVVFNITYSNNIFFANFDYL